MAQYIIMSRLIAESGTFHNNGALLTYLQKSGKTNRNTSYNNIYGALNYSITHFLVIRIGQHLQQTIACMKVPDSIKNSTVWKNLVRKRK
jgi:hypothetical protein